MAFLIFLAVLILGAGLIIGVFYALRPQGPVIPMLRLTSSNSEAETTIMMQRLHDLGIEARVQIESIPLSRDGPGTALGARTYYAEIWVQEEDHEEACRMLGINRPRERSAHGEEPPNFKDTWPN